MATKTTTRARRSTKKGGRRAQAKKATRSGSNRQRDVIALVKADHATVNQLFRRYQALGDRAFRSKRAVADRVIKELSIHAAVEEQVLYPNVRAVLPNGERLVKEAIKEHQSLKEALAALEKGRPESADFDDLMTEIRDEVRHHVKEEENANGILGQLRKRASRDELLQMAKLTRAAKKAAPTRPHPKAPTTPPANLVVGAATAMVDKVRDAVGRR
jgi:hemerythrin superfamily protein